MLPCSTPTPPRVSVAACSRVSTPAPAAYPDEAHLVVDEGPMALLPPPTQATA